MAEAITRPKRGEHAHFPALTMAKRLDRYKPEEEKIVRETLVSKDPMLDKLKRTYKGLKDKKDADIDPAREVSDEFWSLLCAVGERLNCSSKDVEAFSLALAEFQHEKDFAVKAGAFLSALIDGGKDGAYTIRTDHMEVYPAYIGRNNRKIIIVEGDAGDGLGYEMLGGSITVNGNAGAWCGAFMGGGVIIVNGNAAYEVGGYMCGGRIDIEGRFELSPTLAEPSILDAMGNDEIAGEIYHKGHRVWP